MVPIRRHGWGDDRGGKVRHADLPDVRPSAKWHRQILYRLRRGWTFWIHISPFRWLMMFVGRKIQNYTGRGNDLYQTLRFDSARAMIGAIHSSLAEVTERYEPEDGTGGGLPPLVPSPAPPARPSRARV